IHSQRHLARDTGRPPVSRVFGGTSVETVTPAPMTDPAPMVTPPSNVLRAPSQQPSPTVIGAAVPEPSGGCVVRKRTSCPTDTWLPMVTGAARSNSQPSLKPQWVPIRSREAIGPLPVNRGRPQNKVAPPMRMPQIFSASKRERFKENGGKI